jgi:hypothetical protein
VIPGGGLNSTIAALANPSARWTCSATSPRRRRISATRTTGNRQAPSTSIGRGTRTDDHLGLMDHLGIDKFMVIGFCIGGRSWNLLKRARCVVAAVLAQPSGFRPEMPTLFYDNNITGWGPTRQAASRDHDGDGGGFDEDVRRTPISSSPSRATSCASARRPS